MIVWAPRLLALVLFLGSALRFFNYVEDDAFIPMRYAENFRHGHGWVMNPQEHVEGYTSPLFLWLVTLLLRLTDPDHVLLFCKGLGIGLGLGVLLLTERLARQTWPQASWLGGLAALAVAARPQFALSMTNGLETGVAALFLTAAVSRWIDECQRDERGPRWAAVLFAGAALTRPELAAAFPLLWLLRRRRDTWKAGTASLVIYTVPLCLLEAFRLVYYGEALPNTFYAKQLPLSLSIPLGWQYIHSFLFLSLTSAIFLLGGLFSLLQSRRAGVWAIPIVFGLHVLFLLRSGGDWMMDGRFAMVVLPLGAVPLVGGVWAAPAAVARLIPGERRGFRGAVMGALMFLLGWSLFLEREAGADRIAQAPRLHGIGYVLAPHPPLQAWMIGNPDGRLKIGLWVAAHARPGQTVLSSEMGLVTLQNPQVRFLDIRGLTDRRIARMPGYPRDRGGLQGERRWQDTAEPLGRYIRQRRPDWVVLLWDVYMPGLNGADRATDLYIPTGVFPVTLSGRVLHAATWRRRDVPDPSIRQPKGLN